MAILLKVKWVDLSEQTDPCQCIQYIGGDSGEFNWQHTHANAIQSIEQGRFQYYMERDARALKLEVGLTPDGDKYLKTQADTDQPQLLLTLPRRPKSARP